jgi:acetyl esterase
MNHAARRPRALKRLARAGLERLMLSEAGLRAQRVLLLGLLGLPEPALRLLAGRLPVRDGAELDLHTALVLQQADRAGLPPLHRAVVADSRAQTEVTARLLGGSPTPLASVRDLELELGAGTGARRLRARHYVPHGLKAPYPTTLAFHGGGFVVGSLESHDLAFRALAARAECALLAVDYRLAPEHRFPAAADDALDTWRWLVADPGRIDADPTRLGVAGDSAGGNLAAGVCLQAREHHLPQPRFQLLIYPATDGRSDTPSKRTYATGYVLEAESIRWFTEQYLGDGDDGDPRFSPLRATSHGGLAPALVQTASFDPLRDEGRAYADALERAGVPVSYDCRPGLVHGYFNLAGGVPAARRALEAAGDALRKGLARS